MTNIYFCDVCNESVPQADLDLGRALVVKGRIICSICDRAMTQRAEARALQRPANLGLDLDSAAGAAPAPAGVGAGANATGADAAVEGQHAARRARADQGVGVAFTALVAAVCGVGAVWYWARNEFERVERDAALATVFAAGERGDQRAELQRLARELEERASRVQARVDEALSAAQGERAAGAQTQAGELRGLAAQLEELRVSVGPLDEALAKVSRHDQELMALSGRLTTVTIELGNLAESVRQLTERGLSADDGAELDAPQPPPEVRPAWFELTSLLQSPSTADRWQGLIALGETRDGACVPYVAPLLRDKDVFIRMAAARVLGDLGAPAGVEPLIEALTDAELPVRESAADALARITKRSLEFDAQGPEAERARRIKQLREWWAKEREKSAAGDGARSLAR